ncbi:hypothetical protein [Sphingomonas sp. OK281]|uniref:hypothetical protein n=1 Tax=Sphingomonas sp. OK281 TaxID=1881067 RepID=UPI0008E5267E|nr:hypothetical protein [Sphingomonas sp. OK281]SFO45014.1 hypothetical protein SAMN05428984_4302 [Sphingomonas sp. OK281]
MGLSSSEVVRVMVPDGSAWEDVLGFSGKLAELPEAGAYVIDFADVGFTTPGWMAVIGDSLNAFRIRRPDAKRRADNYKRPGLGYAAAAGFFHYFGVDWGQKPGALNSTDAFVPLTVKSVDDLRARAAIDMVHYGDLIQIEAERLVAVLTRLEKGDVFDTLAYSIRELVRNVVEHSEAEHYSFAAQWWPAAGRAEMVVSDTGIGLTQSLRLNPRLNVADDATALRLAVQPGVTSRGRSGRSNDVWRNTGYGLYMTHGICSAAGSFTLISGRSATVADNAGERFVQCDATGTTVVMRLDTAGLGDLTTRLAELRDIAGRASIKPSVASLSKRVVYKTGVSND